MRQDNRSTIAETATVSEARMTSVLDTAVDGIIVMDDEMRILVFNKACEKLFGYSAVEVVGSNVAVIMPPEYANHHDGYVERYLETGQERIIGIGREVLGMHRDGTIFPVELSVGEAHTPEGRQFIGIMRDVRSRKEVEKRLKDLQSQLVHMARISAMDEMGAAIAHELNQPLTAVMLYLQAVLRRRRNAAERGEPLDDRALEIIDKAVGEAERAGAIIQRMRQMVEKRDPQRRAVNMVELVDETMQLTRLGQGDSDVELRRENDADQIMIEVDPVQIQQVIVNLVRNALEAVRGAEDRWVRVAVRSGETRVLVEVADSGHGIADAQVDELFKAFSTGRKSGVGLGLAISRTIVQNHGGDLTVDPGGNGSGARFLLSLPHATQAAASQTTADQK
ncbi:PAS domain-containing sensor histidine kinase [Rhodobium orientis]|uniref:Sensor protein FixL n=2 Tax=Rhodobium orientis TaxID=34017 RepID=A0A327JIZ0_9HYPH|nr:PAS domain-containing sensor histidine kinase [Rhodobium orientis]RAI25183.1 PAS domain-containing sensor histidine kinase [Rhodobium orientis]